MKKYNRGDVWTYDPDPEGKFKQLTKDDFYAIDAMSRRPVVVIRGSDSDNPYNNILVCPGTTRAVPTIKFDQCETMMGHGKPQDQLAIKPYEIRSVAAMHLIKYCGRLEDFEIEKLSDAIDAYLGGGVIADICDEETMVAWNKFRDHIIIPNNVRRSLQPQQVTEEPEEQEPEVEESVPTQEVVKPEEPKKPIVVEPEKLDISGKFTIPKTLSAVRKVCKSYCGSNSLNPGTVAMIETVPLSDVEIILSLSGKQIQSRYTISPSAAGAVKLLAANFKEHGYKFVWPEEDDSVKETKPEAKPEVVVPTKTEFVKKEEVIEDDAPYQDALDKVKYFLTDKTMRYINNKALDVLLTIPEEVVKKHYSGNNFKLQYGAVLKRVGRFPSL